MERPIEDATHDETGSRPVQQLDAAPVCAATWNGSATTSASSRVRATSPSSATCSPRRGTADVVACASPKAPCRSHAPDGATQSRYRMLVAGHVASDIFCLNVVLSRPACSTTS